MTTISSPTKPDPIVVPDELDGQTAITVMRRLFRQRHPSFAEKILRQKRVLNDGRPIERDEMLSAGQSLELKPASKSQAPPQPNRRIRLNVRYEDPDIIIIHKNAGVPMHPGAGHGTDTLLNGLIGLYGKDLLALGDAKGFGLVHRLDRDTSGLLVVARTTEAYDSLREQFEMRRISKTYVALVHGRLTSEEGCLGREVAGRSARTDFKVIERFDDATLVEAQPVTGRMHQIRVHFSSISHPLVGETRYDRYVPKVEKPIFSPRLFLHARDLAFQHPSRDERVSFEEPLPKDLRHALNRLRSRKAT